MVLFCNVGLLRLVLIITAAVTISNSATLRDETKGARWIQYVDATYAVCITSHQDVQISMKLTTLLRCFNVQWKHLQCISSSQPLKKFLAATGTTSALQAPCGLIHLSNTIEASSPTRQWRITVHSQLYLNLTFQELVLSMPHGRCDLLLGPEYLTIDPVFPSLDLSAKDVVSLCGEHSPFSMVWRSSRAMLQYRRVPSITRIGRFRIQYQVCDKRVRTPKVYIIDRASVLQGTKSTLLKLSNVPFFESGPEHVMYTIHLLGNKLRVLNMMFVLTDARKKNFSVDTFDGPGQDELHRLSIRHQLLDTKWILFSTFQGYLKITCKKYHCGGIFIKYRWPSALPFARDIMLSEDLIISINDFAALCSHSNHWYCIFSIDTNIRQHVEISLQTVNFHGPNYLGGFNQPYNCLLAGVTIADGYRAKLISSYNFQLQELGDIPTDLAVDSVFPEITTCYDVPLAVGDRVVWGFPIDNFVSYGSRLTLVIYAYGAYINLNKSEIKLVARPSHSAGLIVSCPTIPADGYLGINADYISGGTVMSENKDSNCPRGNVLFVKLISHNQMGKSVFSTHIQICTISKQQMTFFSVISNLIEQADSGVTPSLFLQGNIFAPEKKSLYGCYIETMDREYQTPFDYNLSIKLPVGFRTIRYGIQATNSTSRSHTFIKRTQLTGQCLRVEVWAFSLYPINMVLNISLSCAKVVRHQLYGGNESIFHHLQKATYAPFCQNFLIPLWNNDNSIVNNNTHLIYLPQLLILAILKTIIKEESQMGKLTALDFNQNIGKSAVSIKIHLHGKCAQHCRRIHVQIVYRALVSHNTVSLEWNLLLNSTGFQVTLFDVPMSGVLLYVTSLNNNCLEKVCSANIDIQDEDKLDDALSIWNGRASGQTPFAEYHLLWSHGEYTWNEAEEICQELDGMHLASISSEKEYLLITRMLMGGVYREFDTDKSYLPLLTPCLMGSPVCLIYIGLKKQVS